MRIVYQWKQLKNYLIVYIIEQKKDINTMSGEEIIERLKFIRENVSNVNLPKAMQDIDYLIDDIFMYKNNCL